MGLLIRMSRSVSKEMAEIQLNRKERDCNELFRPEF
jgi:hypothetical protein